LAVYFILVEEAYGIRPPYGVIILGDGKKVRVANSDQLRAWVLGIADQIREARRNLEKPIPVNQPSAKCRGCGMRQGCGQARF
jgi:CRISPR-associated exonuclease Cas4